MEELSIKNKELLFNDLCARLPYGVIVKYKSREKEGNVKMTHGNIGYVAELGNSWWKECKPYLRPISSITDKEKIELERIINGILGYKAINYFHSEDDYKWNTLYEAIDWFNAHHFDYRGLIEKGLAIAVTEENNPYK